MTVTRLSWYEDRFRAAPETARAEADLARLGGAAADFAFSGADRLAEVSVRAAQAFFLAAAGAWETLGPQGAQRWLGIGAGLTGAPGLPRDCGRAFFALAPATLAPPRLERLAAWAAAARDLAAVSGRLAARYFEATKEVVGYAEFPQRLAPWVGVACELYREHGWRGETLARAYVDAAPVAFAAVAPSNYRLWGALGAALWDAARPQAVLHEAARLVEGWEAGAQRALFQAVLAVSRTRCRDALALLRHLPRALRRTEPELRPGVVDVFRLAAPAAPRDAAGLAPLAGALLRSVPAAERASTVGRLTELASAHPRAALRALRSLPYLYEQAAPSQVADWFHAGRAIAARSGEAGVAYFGLESRTSVRVLDRGSAAASLEEFQGFIRKFIQMLSGTPVSLHGIESPGLRPPLEEFPLENEVTLPLRIDHLPTVEENRKIYVLLAAQVAARRIHGTYRFGTPADAPEGHALRRHLDRPGQPPALEPIFLLTEAVRLHHRICAAYPGLAAAAREAGSALLQRWQRLRVASLDRTLDAILAVVWSAGDALPPPWLPGDLVRIALAAFQPLASPSATVADAMAVAEALARQLAERARRDAAAGADLPVDPDQVEAETMVEPWLYDAAEDAPAAPGDREAAGGAQPVPEDAAPERPAEAVADEEAAAPGQPLDPEEIRRLLEAGARLRVADGCDDEREGVGLYITDLIGRLPRAEIERLRRLLADAERTRSRSARAWVERGVRGECFYYDEWDDHIGDYRARWCRLHEVGVAGDCGEFFQRALEQHAALIPEVRRQFQRLRPERYRKVRGLEDGEDFDLAAVVDAQADLRARRTPSAKLYVARKREEREVATLFLVDMSASTDQPVDGAAQDGSTARRVIDVMKEALVVMASALEDIGDAYAIYGFSGHGRMQVEFYLVKSFAEPLNSAVRARIGGIQPRRSTRMGPALRHAAEKFSAVHVASRNLLLLSDGFPQDHDYGPDRRSNAYGIRDTMVALQELAARGISPFCITVDRAGHDYLRQMCDESRYMVIDDIETLPRELPKIYRRVVRRDGRGGRP